MIAVVNDLHCGSELAVCNPDTTIYKWDENNKRSLQSVDANPAQRYLWGVYTWCAAELFKFAKTAPIHLIINGDYTDGGIWNSMPMDKVTISESGQVRIAFDVINHIAKHKQVKSMRFTSSTAGHAFNSNSADYALADKFAEKYPEKDIRILEHGLAQVGGVYIDYAHHGPSAGLRQWLKGNLMYLYVKDIIAQSKDDGERIPQVVLRGHSHGRVQVCVSAWFGDDVSETWGFTVPSFQLITPFGRKVMKSERKITNGMLAIEVIDGEIGRKKWFTKSKRMPVEEKLL